MGAPAGRLHTKSNLMAELEKMKRTAAKLVPGAPHDVLLVMDATTGQNGLSQAREFTSAVGVTGIVLTKLDGRGKLARLGEAVLTGGSVHYQQHVVRRAGNEFCGGALHLLQFSHEVGLGVQPAGGVHNDSVN